MKDIQHLIRVAIAFVVVISGFLIVRHFMVPKSFGAIGHYRAAALDEIKAAPLRYAGSADCAMCHEDQAGAKAKGPHKTMSCESCHGPLQAHIDAPTEVKPVKPPHDGIRDYCGRCHEWNLSRPKSFPQIKLDEHNPDLECVMCHSSHNPSEPS